jgi:phosphoribosylaminoimidazole-succinocarboxamide synthase
VEDEADAGQHALPYNIAYMISDELLRAQLPHALRQLDLPALGELYRGKVRDNYTRGERIVMVTTDRVSAFDHVLGTIPFKGEILSRLTTFWFDKVKDIAPVHVVEVPDPSVMVVKKAKPFPVEIIVRGYITGSLWRDYQAGKAGYGIPWPKGLKKDQKFDEAVLTPSTKAEYGAHDEPISEAEILKQGLVPAAIWEEARAVALRLFRRGQEWAASRGLILVDTKYEMGTIAEEDGSAGRRGEASAEQSGAKLVVIDEIHTPDSSRYWIADGSEERFRRGEEQRMLDKENIRQWLIQEHGFSGQGTPPPLTDEVRISLARTYVNLYELLTGQQFQAEPGSVEQRIQRNLSARGYLG